MKHPRLTSICVYTALAGIAGCHGSHRNEQAPIVGTWVVKIPEAPFPLHMFVFHADGTVEQSNPDAGDPNSSDSNLMGVWVRDGEGFKGRIVETAADRETHRFLSRGEIPFALKVSGDTFHGTASANFFDADGHHIRGPIQATLDGQRVLP